MTQHPRGDSPDLRNLSPGRRGAEGAQRPQVVAARSVAASISTCSKFFVVRSRGGVPVVEQFVQVLGKLVQ